jgi:hypothetical protein
MKTKLKKLLLCLTLISILSIGTASAKMFGHDCSYSIGPDSTGECRIKIIKTAWYFWIPDRTEFNVSCDSGWYASDFCGDNPQPTPVE